MKKNDEMRYTSKKLVCSHAWNFKIISVIIIGVGCQMKKREDKKKERQAGARRGDKTGARLGQDEGRDVGKTHSDLK